MKTAGAAIITVDVYRSRVQATARKSNAHLEYRSRKPLLGESLLCHNAARLRDARLRKTYQC